MIGRIKKALDTNDETALHLLLNPAENPPGRTTILSATCEKTICDRLEYAASRGFAHDVLQLRQIAGQVATETGTPFQNGIPSHDWVRSFRARHRNQVTIQALQDKEVAKLAAQCSSELVNTLKTALQEVFRNHPQIQNDSRLIWNMDETAVTGETGRKVKVIASRDPEKVATRAKKGKGIGKHLTAVVIANAAGVVLPPLFIFEGKKEQTHWFVPIEKESWMK